MRTFCECVLIASLVVAARCQSAPGDEDSVTASAPRNSVQKEVISLFKQANDAIKTNDLTLAASLLARAKALNPTQQGLWRNFAALADAQGKHEEVIADLQQELRLYPRGVWVYPMLADYQAFHGHMAEEPETLRSWAKADADNYLPVMRLVDTLVGVAKPAEAVAAAEEAFATLPQAARDRPSLQIAYARAQLAAGKTTAGVATLTALIRNCTDPSALNSAAYVLADAGLELPLAEATERDVLARLATGMAAWTGKEPPKTLTAQSATLAASWDTMGWILYREGNAKDAADYAEAAYRSRPYPVVGSHLGDIRAALGNATGARLAYLAGAPAKIYPPGLIETPPLKIARETLEAKLQAMKKAGATEAPAPVYDGWRKVPLGPAEGRDFSAQYRLLLAPGKVLSAEPTGASSVRGGSEMVLAMMPPKLFPTGSKGRLVKLAVVNCHAVTCELIFEP